MRNRAVKPYSSLHYNDLFRRVIFFFFLNTFSRDLDEEMPWKKNNQNREVGCYI